MVASSIYLEGQTGGRGYIGLRRDDLRQLAPGGLAVGAGLFGYADALQLRGGGQSVHALLLLLAIAAGRSAAGNLLRGRRPGGLISLVVAALACCCGTWPPTTVPDEFVGFDPARHDPAGAVAGRPAAAMPAADGMPYRRGEARVTAPDAVDWAALRARTPGEAMTHAYAPYSRLPGRRRRPGRRRPDRRRLQRRERLVRARSVRRVRPGLRRCTPPAAAGSPRFACVDGNGDRADARAAGAGSCCGSTAVRPCWWTPRRASVPMSEMLPRRLRPDDLDRVDCAGP